MSNGQGEGAFGSVPLFKTALHSSLDLWSGYDILSDVGVKVPNKELRKGIDGIDFRTVARWMSGMA